MSLNSFTFRGESFDAHRCIEESKRVVIIATEARDRGLNEALEIVRSRMTRPSTCKSPGKVLSKAAEARNQQLHEIAEAIRDLLSDDLPF